MSNEVLRCPICGRKPVCHKSENIWQPGIVAKCRGCFESRGKTEAEALEAWRRQTLNWLTGRRR